MNLLANSFPSFQGYIWGGIIFGIFAILIICVVININYSDSSYLFQMLWIFVISILVIALITELDALLYHAAWLDYTRKLHSKTG